MAKHFGLPGGQLRAKHFGLPGALIKASADDDSDSEAAGTAPDRSSAEEPNGELNHVQVTHSSEYLRLVSSITCTYSGRYTL